MVVLPAPLGPRNPNSSPGSTENEMPSTAVKSPKRLTRPSTSTAPFVPFVATTTGQATGRAIALMPSQARLCGNGRQSRHSRASSNTRTSGLAPPVRASESYFRSGGTRSHAPGDPGGIRTHSGVHRVSSARRLELRRRLLRSLPRRAEIHAARNVDARKAWNRDANAALRRLCEGLHRFPGRGWTDRHARRLARVRARPACAFGSGCGSWPGRQIGVQPGSVGAGSARARGSPVFGFGMQICGSSRPAAVGRRLERARRRPAPDLLWRAPRRTCAFRRDSRTILPMVPPVGSWDRVRQDHPRPLPSVIGTSARPP